MDALSKNTPINSLQRLIASRTGGLIELSILAAKGVVENTRCYGYIANMASDLISMCALRVEMLKVAGCRGDGFHKLLNISYFTGF